MLCGGQCGYGGFRREVLDLVARFAFWCLWRDGACDGVLQWREWWRRGSGGAEV